MADIKHYISSNFNLLHTHSNWKNLKKHNINIDKNYNGLLLSLRKKNLDIFSFFHFIFYLDNSNYDQTLKELKNLIQIIKKNKKKYFFFYFFNNFHENPIVEKDFNTKFQNLKFDIENIYLKTYNKSCQRLFSERNRIYIKFPFEIKFMDFITKEVNQNINFLLSKPYKLIILDCDNTLWGGILDEDGQEKLRYDGDEEGEIFKQFQIFLKKKRSEGFILTISSKNNEQKVWRAMRKRGMILQKKDFINPKINWKDKAINISQIINQLTLRPKDCLFIDDNPLEIKKVKSKIRDINIISAENPMITLRKIYNDPRLFKNKILKEDLNKYKQYSIKSKFENISDKNLHSIQFYQKLKQVASFEKIKEKNFDRALQLFNKTNQFNFNLNRYDNLSLKKLIKNKAFSIELINFKDKFGDHGIIGAYIIKKDKVKSEIIDFVLSCRVLNRYLEDFIIYRILKKNSNKNLSIYYKKNSVNRELIPDFLRKEFFSLNFKKKNLFNYRIRNIKKFNEIKKIFK